jgi:hypothetical protein
MEEVVFFHRRTRTLLLADLIENFEPGKVRGFYGWLVRLADVVAPDAKTPIDLRLTFLGRKKEARSAFEWMVTWESEKVIMAHGRPYERTARRNSDARSAGWVPGRASAPKRVPPREDRRTGK